MQKLKKNITYLNNRIMYYLPCIYIPTLIFIALEAFYLLCNIRYAKMIAPLGYLLSIFFMFLIHFIFVGITRSLKRATIIVSCIVFVFAIANQIKIGYTDEPLLFSDFLFLNSVGTFTDILDSSVFMMLLKILPQIFLLVILLLSIIFLSARKEQRVFKIYKRLIAIFVSSFILIILFLPISPLNQFILKTVFNSDGRQDDYTNTTMQYYSKYGIISGMYGQLLENRLVEPLDYDEVLVEKLLNNSEALVKSDGTWGKPNIIMVFSESFWDIDVLDEIDFNKPVTPNFNRLKDKGLFFEMISPSYGGISANVEYEILTGSSIRYFNNGYIPYSQLLRSDSYYNVTNVAKDLKENGYRTKVVSTWSNTLFHAQRAYDYFGFDEAHFKENLDNIKYKGKRISDEYATDLIIDEFNRKPPEQSLFYMVLTAQAHMPFNPDKYDEYDIEITKSKLSKEYNGIIRSYAQGVYDADKQLGRLYEYIQALDEPTIIIFYGDHLPYLKTNKGINILPSLEYFSTDDDLLNTYRQYNTECLIVANYDLNKEDAPKYLGPDLVMAYVFHKMNIENYDAYYKYLYSTIPYMPASNYAISVDAEGNIYKTNSLTGKLKATYDRRNWMNWYKFIKVK